MSPSLFSTYLHVFNHFNHYFYGLFILLICTSCTSEATSDASFGQITPPGEVSDLVVYKDMIVAGGLDGLYFIDPETYQIQESYETDFSQIKDLMVYNDTLYIAHDRGLTSYDKDVFTDITTGLDPEIDLRINALAADAEGHIWIGGFDGIHVLADGLWTHYSSDDTLLHNNVFSLFCDQSGGIWIGHYASPKGGISYTKDDAWLYFTIEDGLPHNNITDFHQSGKLIYASTGFYTEGGIAIFTISDSGPILTDTIQQDWGTNGQKVRSISSKDKTIWIGSEYDGLTLMTPDTVRTYTIEDGLSNNEIKAILFYKDRTWLGTRNGISYSLFND